MNVNGSSKYRVSWTALMCVPCGPPVLLVHLSKESLQLRTALETRLIIGLGVLRRETGGRGAWGGVNKAGYSQLLRVYIFQKKHVLVKGKWMHRSWLYVFLRIQVLLCDGRLFCFQNVLLGFWHWSMELNPSGDTGLQKPHGNTMTLK